MRRTQRNGAAPAKLIRMVTEVFALLAVAEVVIAPLGVKKKLEEVAATFTKST